MAAYSWHALFIVVGVVGILLGVFGTGSIRSRGPHERQRSGTRLHRRGRRVRRRACTRTAPFSWSNVGKLLSFRQVWGAGIGQFAGNSTLVFFLTWFPTYLATERHMPWVKVGFFAVLPFIAAAIGVLAGGWVSDQLLKTTGSANIARKAPIIVGLLLASLIVTANWMDSNAAVIAVLSIAFFGQGMVGLGWTLISDIAPKQLMGLTGGLFNFAANLAGIITPIVIGFIVAGTGSFIYALAFVGAVALLGVFAYVFILGDVHRLEVDVASGHADASHARRRVFWPGDGEYPTSSETCRHDHRKDQSHRSPRLSDRGVQSADDLQSLVRSEGNRRRRRAAGRQRRRLSRGSEAAVPRHQLARRAGDDAQQGDDGPARRRIDDDGQNRRLRQRDPEAPGRLAARRHVRRRRFRPRRRPQGPRESRARARWWSARAASVRRSPPRWRPPAFRRSACSISAPAAALSLADRLATHYPALKLATGSANPQGYDIVVNATPVGMNDGDPLPIDVEAISPTAFVGEVVMREEFTPLLRAAKAKGCQVQVGTDMLFEMIPAYLEFFGFGTTPEELRRYSKLHY